jgi:hypothetical protein
LYSVFSCFRGAVFPLTTLLRKVLLVGPAPAPAPAPAPRSRRAFLPWSARCFTAGIEGLGGIVGGAALFTLSANWRGGFLLSATAFLTSLACRFLPPLCFRLEERQRERGVLVVGQLAHYQSFLPAAPPFAPFVTAAVVVVAGSSTGAAGRTARAHRAQRCRHRPRFSPSDRALTIWACLPLVSRCSPRCRRSPSSVLGSSVSRARCCDALL